ncbi:MAG: AraC family transcriptional regulator [Bacteroidota bacterium]
MVSKFTPAFNEVYFINKYTLYHILDGQGAIQVDFENYNDWTNKLIFLEKGQYIKFLSDSFVVRRIEFPGEAVFNNKEVRVLFKHLVSLGYINFDDCEACQRYLTNTVFSDNVYNIIDASAEQWFWQNPFHAEKEEYHVIFDLKDIIDEQYQHALTASQLVALINQQGRDAFSLVKEKIGLSVKAMLERKRLTEGKKEVAFTDKPIKEIGYDLGYRDPAYFSRVFKRKTGQSPEAFRSDIDFEKQDLFVEDLYTLLKAHHAEHRALGFYADQMHMTVKSLSRNVRKKLNASLGQLIRHELINSAKIMLTQGEAIQEVAFRLGFEESNHFSAFFKRYTGMTPSQFKMKKYKQ